MEELKKFADWINENCYMNGCRLQVYGTLRRDIATYYMEKQAKNNESLHLVSESDIKDVTEKWVKSMLHSDEIKEDDCRYNFNHGVRIGIELSKKANSH